MPPAPPLTPVAASTASAAGTTSASGAAGTALAGLPVAGHAVNTSARAGWIVIGQPLSSQLRLKLLEIDRHAAKPAFWPARQA